MLNTGRKILRASSDYADQNPDPGWLIAQGCSIYASILRGDAINYYYPESAYT